MDKVVTHVWQEAGMGKAPYRCTGHVDTGSVTTTCDYCGAGLRHVFFVQDSLGSSYKVGMDCVGKTYDSRLTTEAKRLKAKADREKRQAKAQAAWQARLAAQQAELDRQRQANGGETDQERDARTQREQREQIAQEANGWLIDDLDLRNPRHGGWDGLRDLLETPIHHKHPRYIEIVCKIWCNKTGGRTGSKACLAAEERFWDKIEQLRKT